MEAERRRLVVEDDDEDRKDTKAFRYDGARSCFILYTKSRILKMMR